MKNGINKIFNVKKSFTIANQAILMEGDQLIYITTEQDEKTDKADIYFEVVNSFWSEGMEINLTVNEVAEYLTYDKIIH